MSQEEQAATATPAADASTAKQTEEAAVAPKEEGVKVFAGNLSYKSTDDDLKALFEPLGGDILSIQVVFRGTRSSGYGFVSYKEQSDADKAVAELNNKDIGGRALVVELAKPPTPKERKPRAKKAPRAPRAEDAVDGEEETAQNGEATEEGEAAESKPKRTRAPRRRGPKKDADGNIIPKPEPTATEEGADGEAAPAARAPRARKPKAARIDDETGEPIPPRERAPRAPRPPREAPTGEPSKTLIFVANLPFSLDDEGLNKIFTDGGVTVSTARIVKRKFGIKRSKGFGFVDCASEGEQKKALALDGHEVESRAIAVKVALNSQQDPENKTEETPDANAAAAAAEPTTDGPTTLPAQA